MKITKDNFLIKLCLSLVLIFAVFSILLPSSVLADSLWDRQIGMDVQNDGVGGAFDPDLTDRNDVRDPRIVIAEAINVFLGFMGVVFLVLIIYAGILWMTAAGKEDQVGKAKSLLIAAVIGLIIVVASFAIAELVASKVFDATNRSTVQTSGDVNDTLPHDTF